MIKMMAVCLVVLLIVIGGERGAITLISLIFNMVILGLSIALMSWGFNPLLVTFFCCILINCSTLFYQNGKNAKTIASFISVTAVMLILFIVVYRICYDANMQGINEIIQGEDQIQGLSPAIHINMASIAVSIVIIGLIGAAMDTSIAVSSAVYEVYKNNRDQSILSLYHSGMAIGRDILGTMVNTLYFAYIGEGMTLFIFLKNYDYSLAKMINSKAFFQGFASVAICSIGCTLIIPITAAIESYILKNPDKFKKQLAEDKLFQ